MSKKARKLRATAKNEAETARSEMDKLSERLKKEEKVSSKFRMRK